ncbi:MAG TPA: hypothetical protein VIQ05_09045 [Tardiphaga sp.]
MTPETKPYPVVDMLIDMFGNWLRARRDINELREFDSGEFARIAHELGVSPDNLDAFVRQGPHAADELPQLLKALGIDRDAVARSQPLVLRDMERVCSLCPHKRQCDHDLAAGSSARHYEEYCCNAQTIDGLAKELH